MKISEFSIKHPVVITMLIIVLAVFGIYSVTLMPTEFMADISMPQAIVYTIYPGASAEDVEQDVTKILEDSFVTLPHFKSVDSASYNSMSWITITYADGYDAYDQLQELRNRISELIELLPSGIQGEPRALIGGVSMLPVISFSVQAGKDSGRVSDFIKNGLNIYDNPLKTLANKPEFPYHLENMNHYANLNPNQRVELYNENIKIMYGGKNYGKLCDFKPW